MSNTFVGIRPVDVAGFVGAQFAGAFAATVLIRWLKPSLKEEAAAVGP
jgi:glycerol uptake facilitator-like aquaporin